VYEYLDVAKIPLSSPRSVNGAAAASPLADPRDPQTEIQQLANALQLGMYPSLISYSAPVSAVYSIPVSAVYSIPVSAVYSPPPPLAVYYTRVSAVYYTPVQLSIGLSSCSINNI